MRFLPIRVAAPPPTANLIVSNVLENYPFNPDRDDHDAADQCQRLANTGRGRCMALSPVPASPTVSSPSVVVVPGVRQTRGIHQTSFSLETAIIPFMQ
jgi:hypothetical protein